MIEQLVNEINGLLRDGYPYSALGIALTLPDICGNIAYPNTKVADHYKKWYSEYVNPISALKFKDGFDEEICYKLRCAYLHSGNFDLGNADAVKNDRLSDSVRSRNGTGSTCGGREKRAVQRSAYSFHPKIRDKAKR